MNIAAESKQRSISRIELAGAAIVVGTVAGAAAVLFWVQVSAMQGAIFGASPKHLFSQAAGLPWWVLVAGPTVGGLLIGIVVRKLMQNGKPVGVADVIEASALRGGRMPLRNGVIGALVSAASIGCGASVGREGPLVHLGATIGAWTRERLRLPEHLSRRLIGCGVAAGIAASFNAPIAGAIFAIEVVVGKYSLHTFAPVAIGSISGAIVSRFYYGGDPAFPTPEVTLGPIIEMPLIVLLALLSAAIVAVLLKSVEWVSVLHSRLNTMEVFRPALGGLGVGILAITVPQVLGVGYEATDAVLHGSFTLQVLVMILIAKIAATALSLGSGFGGGIFSPSVLIGAAAGAMFGLVVTAIVPGLQTSANAFAIVGVGATAGAVLGAPLSTTLIVFELTGDYSLTIAVMLAVIISSVLVNDFWGRSFFSWQLGTRGIDLSAGNVELLLGQTKMRDLMRTDTVTVPADASLDEVRSALMGKSPFGAVVVDLDGSYRGQISPLQLNAMLPSGAGADTCAAEICKVCAAHAPSESLNRVLPQAEADPISLIPVVDTDDSRFLGHVVPADLLRSYRGILDAVHRDETPTA